MKFYCLHLWTLILLALIGFHSNALSQSPYYFMSESRAEEVLALKNKAPIDSQIVANLSLQNVYQEQNDSLCLHFASQGLDLVKEHKRDIYLGWAGRLKGNALFYNSEYIAAKAVYLQAATAYSAQGDEIKQAYCLMAAGKCYLVLSEFDSSLYYFESALPFIQSNGNQRALSSYIGYLANYYQVIGDLEKLDFYTDSLIRIAERSGNREMLAKAYDQKGNQLFYRHDYKQAIRFMAIARPILDSVGYTGLLIENEANQAFIYSLMGFFDSAIHYNLSALERCRMMKDSSNMAFLMANISVLYQKNRDAEKSQSYREKVMEYLSKIDERTQLACYTVLLESYASLRDQVQFDQLLRQLKHKYPPEMKHYALQIKYLTAQGDVMLGRNLEQAKSLLLEIKTYSEDLGSIMLPHMLDLTLAQCYLKLQKPELALKYIKLAEQLVLQYPSFQAKSSVYLAGLEIAQYSRDLVAVAQYRDLYEKALLEDMDVRHSISLQMAETKYLTEQIRSQRDLETQKAQNAQQRQSQTLVITWLVGLGLILVGGLSVFLFRGNQQQRKLTLEVEQQRDRNQTLYNEMNHRVKNNFQMLSNLLNLQERQAVSGEAKEALKAGSSRMEAMALLHRQLYGEGEIHTVNLRDYLTRLTEDLVRAYYGPQNGFDLQLDIVDLEMDIEPSVSLGIIANEWITNALKYAANSAPYLKVSLQLLDAQKAELSVEDQGPGLAEDFDPKNAESYGLQLVYMMSDQLNGTINHASTQGTKWQLQFPIEPS